jgi:tetratricopeptide (TPR) repeat protein
VHSLIVAVTIVAVILLGLVVYVAHADQDELVDRLHAFHAGLERLAQERAKIHITGPLCRDQRRLWIIPVGRQCPACRANDRQVELLTRELPLPAQILRRAGTPLRYLLVASRQQAHARVTARKPRLAGVTSSVLNAPGPHLRRRIRRDIARLQPRAQAGDPQAQYQLGMCFKDLDDLDQAQTWYQKAADQGHLPALVNLGVVHEHAGRTDQALATYVAAAERDDPVGAYNAAVIAGRLGDPFQAHRWMLHAAELGHPGAQANLESRTR